MASLKDEWTGDYSANLKVKQMAVLKEFSTAVRLEMKTAALMVEALVHLMGIQMAAWTAIDSAHYSAVLTVSRTDLAMGSQTVALMAAW